MSSLLARLHAYQDRFIQLLNIGSVVVSLFLVLLLSIETFKGSKSYFLGGYDRIQYYVCLYLLADFALLWLLSKDRWRFFKRYFILIFLAIPYISIFQYFRLDYTAEVEYFARFVPLVRGSVALAILIGMAGKGRVTGLFISYMTLLITLCYFLTLMFYFAEYTTNKQVSSYYDALWWAGMTVTTLGPDIIPITALGKISTTALGIVGMTVFPIFTVYITTLVQDYTHHRRAKAATGHGLL